MDGAFFKLRSAGAPRAELAQVGEGWVERAGVPVAAAEFLAASWDYLYIILVSISDEAR